MKGQHDEVGRILRPTSKSALVNIRKYFSTSAVFRASRLMSLVIIISILPFNHLIEFVVLPITFPSPVI